MIISKSLSKPISLRLGTLLNPIPEGALTFEGDTELLTFEGDTENIIFESE